MDSDYRFDSKVTKVSEELGLVLGWGIIETVDGEPYFDTQGDHVPGSTIIKSMTDFMLNSRVQTDMHEQDAQERPVLDGDVVFAFPLTAEVAKAFEIETKTTGLLVAIRPSTEVLAKYKSGAYTGFSIGGRRIEEQVVEA